MFSVHSAEGNARMTKNGDHIRSLSSKRSSANYSNQIVRWIERIHWPVRIHCSQHLSVFSVFSDLPKKCEID